MIELHTCATPNGYGVSIALEEMGLAYDLRVVDVEHMAHKRPEFLKLNPNGRVPVLVDTETGVTVWESAAIRLYLAERTGQLMPKDPARRWQAMGWIMLQSTGVGPNQSQANIFKHFFGEELPTVTARFRNETKRLYGVADGHLKHHEYLADEYSIADIGLWPWVRISDYGDISLDDYPHLKAWFERIALRPAVSRGLVPVNRNTEQENYEAAQRMLMR